MRKKTKAGERWRKAPSDTGGLPDRFATLAHRILAARLHAGLTADQAAKVSGNTRQSISMWESGETKSPHLEKLEKFAEATGVRVGWLLTREPPDPELRNVRPRQRPRLVLDENIQLIPELPVVTIGSRTKLDPHFKGSPVWAIPRDVVEHTLRGIGSKFVVVRSTFELEDVTPRDFLIVDTGYTAIDRSGIYFLKNRSKNVHYVSAQKNGHGFKVTGALGFKYRPGHTSVVGRVAAVIKPT